MQHPFQSWLCAAREVFFTWVFLGTVMLQLASHNRFHHNLARDTTIVSIITVSLLVLSGMTGVALQQTLSNSGYKYAVSSFETSASYEFLAKASNAHALGGKETGIDGHPMSLGEAGTKAANAYRSLV